MSNWNSYSSSLLRYADLGFSLDLSLMDLSEDFYSNMGGKIDKAVKDIAELEEGAIANPDEGRMVGHYWLRNADLAPNDEIKEQITAPLAQLKDFSAKVHAGEITAPNGELFNSLLIVGIGGSALGPQLVTAAIGKDSKLATFYFDNTDPEGIDTVIENIGDKLATTIVVVISKSGGTAETRNGMLEAKSAFEKAGLDFAKHTCAVTGEGSKLFNFAQEQGFLTTFPMEDWVGGRTSVMSTVGLVPMALQGLDIDQFLAGAADMDQKTRVADCSANAGLQLALAWYNEGNGKGEKDMVVLPYKDSLVLFSKYLQQLVMESLGKEHDLDGNVVNQGIAVYGNKGSTDQHAYVQQLRDGVHNFFTTFIEVRKGRSGGSIQVEDGVTSADFLQGFLRGTRKALYQSGRRSVTISIDEVTPYSLGTLIGLFERAVSYYASLVNINAYHQPGVEAGKKAAAAFLDLLKEVKASLSNTGQTADEISGAIGADAEDVYHCLTHLSSNGGASITEGSNPTEDQFTCA